MGLSSCFPSQASEVRLGLVACQWSFVTSLVGVDVLCAWLHVLPDSFASPWHGTKGNQAKIPEPGSGTDDPLGCEPLVRGSFRGSTCQVRRGNATDPEDADRGFRKSYLFSRSGRGPGNLSEGDRVLAFNARSVSNTGRRRENSCQALENSGEGHAEVTRRIVPISAAGLRGVQPLVDRTM
jgi:hypothetical protein